jgi:hypothetical protein
MARGSADGNWQPIKLPSDVDSAVKENSKPISCLESQGDAYGRETGLYWPSFGESLGSLEPSAGGDNQMASRYSCP